MNVLFPTPVFPIMIRTPQGVVSETFAKEGPTVSSADERKSRLWRSPTWDWPTGLLGAD